MLFLGAGASKAVDVGDLKKLTKTVNTEIRNMGYGELLQHIEDTLNKANKGLRFFNQGEIDSLAAQVLHIRTD
jgi:hypothetical protein